MTFDKIIAEITSGLTGNYEDDIQYLIDQSAKYKTHEYTEEITRAIGRIIYNILPYDNKKEAQQILGNMSVGIETTIEEAEFQMYKNNYNKALEIMEPLIASLETKGWYKDDSISEYRCFENILEEIMYKTIFQPTKDIRKISENYTNAYYKYGIILFELKKCNEARQMLEKANRYNPVSTDVLFELSETYKVNQEWDEYLKINNSCLQYAYSSKALARCYRNYGFYFIEQSNYKMAAVLFYVSMNYEEDSKAAQSELLYISNILGEAPKFPIIENVIESLEKYNIQIGPNKLILNLAYSIAKTAQKNNNNNMAKNFYKIFYDLTKDKDVKNIIDSIDEVENTKSWN
jgi:tetratricopeptide (TPR) repeat protein